MDMCCKLAFLLWPHKVVHLKCACLDAKALVSMLNTFFKIKIICTLSFIATIWVLVEWLSDPSTFSICNTMSLKSNMTNKGTTIWHQPPQILIWLNSHYKSRKQKYLNGEMFFYSTDCHGVTAAFKCCIWGLIISHHSISTQKSVTLSRTHPEAGISPEF